MRFEDRKDAGRALAGEFDASLASSDLVVCGLPRGGVIVAAELARSLHAPLGIVNVRKIVHPHNEEFAIGALAEGCDPVFNSEDTSMLSRDELAFQVSLARSQIRKRREKYASVGITPLELHDKTVLLVDDGSATGLTMRAAVACARRHNASRVEVALPVAPQDVVDELKEIADSVVVLLSPRFFAGSVGAYYRNFEQVDDVTVMKLLREDSYVYQAAS